MHTSNPDWRDALLPLDPLAARLPASLHAGMSLARRGLWREAVAAYRELLEADGDNLSAWNALAELLRAHGLRHEADDCRRRVFELEARQLGLDGDQADTVVGFMKAVEGDGEAPALAPAPYVAALFDRYADDFDAHLSGDLAYRCPQMLFEAVQSLSPAGVKRDLLDLGCGTGLAGQCFLPLAETMIGVDLSPGMLDKARAKGIYQHLIEGDIVDYLRGCSRSFDLIVAADVLNYLGDLAPVLNAAAARLADDGLFAFSVEAAAEDEVAAYTLAGNRRYRHSLSTLLETASSSGLKSRSVAAQVIRQQRGQPVQAHICVFSRA